MLWRKKAGEAIKNAGEGAAGEVEQYVQSVCSQIRFAKARDAVAVELRTHLEEQVEADIKRGEAQDEAVRNAIRSMGDPIAVGTELDRTHRPKPAWGLIALTVLCIGIGFFCQQLGSEMSLRALLSTQLASLIVGTLAMAGAYFLDFTLIGKHAGKLFALLLLGLVALLLISPRLWGRSVYALYMALLLPLGIAGMVYKMRGRGIRGVLLSGVCTVAAMLAVSLIPSFTSMTLVFIVGVALMTAAIAKGWYGGKKWAELLTLYIPVVIGVTLVAIDIAGSEYRTARISSTFTMDPQLNYTGYVSRQLMEGAKLVGTGSLPLDMMHHPATGAAIDASQAVRLWLPGAWTDYLLVNVIHSLGWLPCAAIVGAILALVACAYRLCRRQKNVLGYLVSLAVICTFILEIVVYLCNSVGIHFVTQLTLPLISGGGWYLVVHMALMGVLLSTFRTGKWVRDAAPREEIRKRSRIAWDQGRLTIDFSIRRAKA